MNSQKIIVITGPTASGKTDFAIKMAARIDGEIINSDSLQVYKENPILSAQPTIEERGNIPHHLFGYISGAEEYNIARWLGDSVEQIKECKNPILVGGTGFYLKHLIFGLSTIPEIDQETRDATRSLYEKIGPEEFYQALRSIDPEVASNLNPNNYQKTIRAYEVIKSTGKSILYWRKQNRQFFPIDSFKMIILHPDREILYQNCNQRFLKQLENGAIEEVKYLMQQNFRVSTGIMKSHAVPELMKYINGEWTLKEAIEKSQQVVRNYAKRQTTWFKHQFNHADLDINFVNDVTNY
ncbi:MAG: tRNA (adenosine(37)-N6)-dimethylallyltransferase MiaA [Pseudomonadota bacterium]